MGSFWFAMFSVFTLCLFYMLEGIEGVKIGVAILGMCFTWGKLFWFWLNLQPKMKSPPDCRRW